MLKIILGTVLILSVAACARTPLQQCQSPLRRALSDNQTQIDDTQQNIERGYVFVPAKTSIGVRFCASPNGKFSLCTGTDGQLTYRKIPVDVEAESAKLRVLLSRKSELLDAYAQCAERFPAAA